MAEVQRETGGGGWRVDWKGIVMDSISIKTLKVICREER